MEVVYHLALVMLKIVTWRMLLLNLIAYSQIKRTWTWTSLMNGTTNSAISQCCKDKVVKINYLRIKDKFVLNSILRDPNLSLLTLVTLHSSKLVCMRCKKSNLLLLMSPLKGWILNSKSLILWPKSKNCITRVKICLWSVTKFNCPLFSLMK